MPIVGAILDVIVVARTVGRPSNGLHCTGNPTLTAVGRCQNERTSNREGGVAHVHNRAVGTELDPHQKAARRDVGEGP